MKKDNPYVMHRKYTVVLYSAADDEEYVGYAIAESPVVACDKVLTEGVETWGCDKDDFKVVFCCLGHVLEERDL